MYASPERSSIDNVNPDLSLQSFTFTWTTCSASQLPITYVPVDSVLNLIPLHPNPWL